MRCWVSLMGKILCGKSCSWGLIISPLQAAGHHKALRPEQAAGIFR